MLVGVKRWIALALLAAGCYRSAPPPAAPAAPAAEPSRPAYYEARATYAHARFHSMRQAPGPRSVIAEAIEKLGEFADDICACTDRTCADRVSQELTQWSMDLQRDHADLKPSEEEMEEASHVTERLSKCMMAAMSYSPPPPPPPPATP